MYDCQCCLLIRCHVPLLCSSLCIPYLASALYSGTYSYMHRCQESISRSPNCGKVSDDLSPRLWARAFEPSCAFCRHPVGVSGGSPAPWLGRSILSPGTVIPYFFAGLVLFFLLVYFTSQRRLHTMAPVIWGLDLKEIHYNKFKSSYMWNSVGITATKTGRH